MKVQPNPDESHVKEVTYPLLDISGTFPDGSIFDSRPRENPLLFRKGIGQVIKGNLSLVFHIYHIASYMFRIWCHSCFAYSTALRQ